jgi:glycosyltransferase involved in cell wall biosynthesis
VRGARALVLPSEWEAFGLVVLEAMAAGTPAIATDVGGAPDLLDRGRAGRIVRFGDVAGLAAALRATVEDPTATREQVARATERVRGYDWQASADRFLAIYRELAGA